MRSRIQTDTDYVIDMEPERPKTFYIAGNSILKHFSLRFFFHHNFVIKRWRRRIVCKEKLTRLIKLRFR